MNSMDIATIIAGALALISIIVTIYFHSLKTKYLRQTKSVIIENEITGKISESNTSLKSHKSTVTKGRTNIVSKEIAEPYRFETCHS